MIRQLRLWLGPARVRLIVGSLIATGITSLLLAAFAADAAWSLTVQTLLAVTFLVITATVIGTRLDPRGRQRLVLTVGPALGLAALGAFLPQTWFPVALGAAFGWLLAVQFLVRDTLQMEYRKAIRHMRKQEYKDAIKVMGDLIKREPLNPEHIRFRAELKRLAGQTGAAIKDYQRVVELAPDQAIGYNGLAEVYLQKGDFEQARGYAEQAYQREPDFWVAPYNLGMIEDRLHASEAVIEHLSEVLEKGLPDSRHRLLTHLWLGRAHYRLGDEDAAARALQAIKRETKGLREWKTILADQQSATLRQVLEADVRLAEQAATEQVTPAELFGQGT